MRSKSHQREPYKNQTSPYFTQRLPTRPYDPRTPQTTPSHHTHTSPIYTNNTSPLGQNLPSPLTPFSDTKSHKADDIDYYKSYFARNAEDIDELLLAGFPLQNTPAGLDVGDGQIESDIVDGMSPIENGAQAYHGNLQPAISQGYPDPNALQEGGSQYTASSGIKPMSLQDIDEYCSLPYSECNVTLPKDWIPDVMPGIAKADKFVSRNAHRPLAMHQNNDGNSDPIATNITSLFSSPCYEDKTRESYSRAYPAGGLAISMKEDGRYMDPRIAAHLDEVID